MANSRCASPFMASSRLAARPVEVVNVQVGQLRQVVPETLSYCWTIVCEGGELDGSRLAIESIPVVVRCADCGHHPDP